jgi:AcrR family transcriptional regulator
MGEQPVIRPRSSRRPREGARQLLRREDWTAAAQAELVISGVSGVTVGSLARRLKVTRGSFYWHFKNRGDLLRALLKFWEEANTGSFERALASSSGGGGFTEFLAIVNLLLAEKDYSPAFDLAVRDWARTSREAAAAVRRADERRMDVLHRIFVDMGFSDPEALVRARITYFQQIGYYTLGIHEEPEARRKLLDYYVRVLVGKSLAEMVATASASA